MNKSVYIDVNNIFDTEPSADKEPSQTNASNEGIFEYHPRFGHSIFIIPMCHSFEKCLVKRRKKKWLV